MKNCDKRRRGEKKAHTKGEEGRGKEAKKAQ